MNKIRLLSLISESLDSGDVTKDELQVFLQNYTGKNQGAESARRNPPNRLSAVDIMFYIAGIVLFASIIALIAQSWDSGVSTRIMLSSGLGIAFWALALYLIQRPQQGDIQRGVTGALLLTGSLSLIAGGFIIANEFVDYTDFHFYATAVTLGVLGVLHICFGSSIKRDLVTLLGVLLSVAAFPVLVFGILDDSDFPSFVMYLVAAIGGGLLAYATRVVSRIGVSSHGSGRFFDSLSACIVLLSLYAASYDDTTGPLWLITLIAGIIALFYLSIIMQDKLMLGNGSFFMVLAIITVSFRYFSGYGVATSLFIGAVGLIGTAVIATTINRRYLK